MPVNGFHHSGRERKETDRTMPQKDDQSQLPNDNDELGGYPPPPPPPPAAVVAEQQQTDNNLVPPSQSSSVRKPATMLETISDVGVSYGTRVARETFGLQATGVGAKAAFHQIARGFENYMNEGQPLQMLHDLQLCGPVGISQRLTFGNRNQIMTTEEEQQAIMDSQQHPLAPPALRHIRSSPLQSRPSIFDDHHSGGSGNNNEDDLIPPPIPLDPFLRSSSTPSSFRQRSIGSAFETAYAPSAFRHPRANFVSDTSARYSSAFDPVKYYARQLEDMERTSIEVMDMGPDSSSSNMMPVEEQTRRGAASRAARFLSDVRVLRRRRRRQQQQEKRGGRENPARPTAVSVHGGEGAQEENNDTKDTQVDASITIVTEPISPNPNETSLLSQSSELSAIEKGKLNETALLAEEVCSQPILLSDPEDAKGEEGEKDEDDDGEPSPANDQYQQLDSDLDEEEDHYQRIEAQLQSESPGTIPSPSYQHLIDDPTPAPTERQDETSKELKNKPSLRVKVSSMEKRLDTSVASPSPTRMASGDINSLTSGSIDSVTESPITAQSGSTSGHTTQATSASSSVGQSGLSTISETDREVMEANKKGKQRRSLSSLPTVRKVAEHDGTSIHSSSTTSSSSRGYIALDNSPVSLRDGANVPADRFFKQSPNSSSQVNTATSVIRSNTNNSASTRRSGQTNSPSTSESATLTSSSSSREEPPTFVSYLDREAKLVSVREATESSSQRAKDEQVREGSPAELVDYSQVLFEEAKAPRGDKTKQQHKFRRPPRSPYKRSSSTPTPPPRSPVVSYHQLSPPRNIVDHTDPTLLSRPNVMRTTPAAFPDEFGGSHVVDDDEEEVVVTDTSKVLMSCGGDGLLVGVGGVKGRAYEDGNVEILKTDSKDDLTAPVVTPEKTGSSDA